MNESDIFAPGPARERLLAHIDTRPLRRPDRPTKALVVFNPGAEPVRGIAVFSARFPVRAAVGPQPVTVRDAAGAVIPSRRSNETLTPHDDSSRVWWTFDLELWAEAIPARGWRAYAATYERAPETPDPPVPWDTAPRPALTVAETDIHGGDLPDAYTGYSPAEPAPPILP